MSMRNMNQYLLLVGTKSDLAPDIEVGITFHSCHNQLMGQNRRPQRHTCHRDSMGLGYSRHQMKWIKVVQQEFVTLWMHWLLVKFEPRIQTDPHERKLAGVGLFDDIEYPWCSNVLLQLLFTPFSVITLENITQYCTKESSYVNMLHYVQSVYGYYSGRPKLNDNFTANA